MTASQGRVWALFIPVAVLWFLICVFLWAASNLVNTLITAARHTVTGNETWHYFPFKDFWSLFE